jgi:hypothetical protein
MDKHLEYIERRDALIKQLFRLMTTESKAYYTPGEAIIELAFLIRKEPSTIKGIVYRKEEDIEETKNN